ncbi:hypothetical protein HOY82DRAFT_538037 [Tuber indicum]|nr:hypothetical protein HOY82DRAFT_538037 [Tuber indicum]
MEHSTVKPTIDTSLSYSIDHLRRVGCIAYRRIPDETLESKSVLKFGARSRISMMLGCTSSTKIWRLWDFDGNRGQGRLVNCSDVKFIESQNAWEKVHGKGGQHEASIADLDLIGNAFEIPTGGHPPEPSELIVGIGSEEGQDTGGMHFTAKSEQSPVSHIPRKTTVVEAGGTHNSCNGSPVSETSGKHFGSELSLVGLEEPKAITVAETATTNMDIDCLPYGETTDTSQGLPLQISATAKEIISLPEIVQDPCQAESIETENSLR